MFFTVLNQQVTIGWKTDSFLCTIFQHYNIRVVVDKHYKFSNQIRWTTMVVEQACFKQVWSVWGVQTSGSS